MRSCAISLKNSKCHVHKRKMPSPLQNNEIEANVFHCVKRSSLSFLIDQANEIANQFSNSCTEEDLILTQLGDTLRLAFKYPDEWVFSWGACFSDPLLHTLRPCCPVGKLKRWRWRWGWLHSLMMMTYIVLSVHHVIHVVLLSLMCFVYVLFLST